MPFTYGAVHILSQSQLGGPVVGTNAFQFWTHGNTWILWDRYCNPYFIDEELGLVGTSLLLKVAHYHKVELGFIFGF